MNLKDFKEEVRKLRWFNPPTESIRSFVEFLEKIRFLANMAKYGGNLPGSFRKPTSFYQDMAAEIECLRDEYDHALIKDAVEAYKSSVEKTYNDHHDFGCPVFNAFYRAVIGLKWVPATGTSHGKFLLTDETSGRYGQLRDIAMNNGGMFISFWNRQCEINNRTDLKIK